MKIDTYEANSLLLQSPFAPLAEVVGEDNLTSIFDTWVGLVAIRSAEQVLAAAILFLAERVTVLHSVVLVPLVVPQGVPVVTREVLAASLVHLLVHHLKILISC
jgi:hypothetical protein